MARKGSIYRTALKRGSYKGKSTKPGGGGRFAALEAEARASGASNPAAVAAAAGRKSLGQAEMTRRSVLGRRRAARRRAGK